MDYHKPDLASLERLRLFVNLATLVSKCHLLAFAARWASDGHDPGAQSEPLRGIYDFRVPLRDAHAYRLPRGGRKPFERYLGRAPCVYSGPQCAREHPQILLTGVRRGDEDVETQADEAGG